MNNSHRDRLDRLKSQLAAQKFDTLIVLIEENRRYLSGYTGEDTQFDETAGALLITASHQILATDTRFDLQAKNEAPEYEIVCYKKGLGKELPVLLKRLQSKRVGFESMRLSVADHAKFKQELDRAGVTVEMMPVKDLVEDFRTVKTEDEINIIRNALSLAETAFMGIIDIVKPGITEKELAWALEKKLREAGADALSFPSIIASGPNGALPHAIPQDRPVRVNEPLLFDWGCRLNGYCSDISRTVFIGKPDKTFNTVYRVVSEAKQMAIEAIREGVGSKSIDQIARDHIEQSGFKGKFGHGLGHGVGLAVHEAPRLSPLRDTILKAGMVVTVEPGIYLPDWGGVRLEDLVVVREDGAEVLNTMEPIKVLDV